VAAGISLLSGGRARKGRGGGRLGATWGQEKEQREGGPGSRPTGDSAGGAAWPRRRAGRTREGEGADRWATATVPGGGTG
jgi:hypothetical protein